MVSDRPRSFRLEHEGHVWSLADVVQAGRAQLEEVGFERPRPREPIGLDATNRLSFVRTWFALRALGAGVVALPTALPEAERHRRLLLAGARREILTIPGRHEVMLRPAPGTGAPLPTDVVVFTSGTEGPAKAALLTEDAFRQHARLCAERVGSGPESRWLLSLSPAHVGGLALLTRALHHGCTIVVPSEPLPHDLEPLLAQENITHVSLVPTQLQRWLQGRVGGPGLAKVTALVGGAACPPRVLEAARAMGLRALATYGLTETASQVATSAPDSPPDTVGPPLPGVQVQIVDERSRPASTGRILVRGPTVFRGYQGDPAGTEDARRDGWLWTKDYGSFDAHGNLRIAGRLDRIINTGGHKVDPSRVEAALATHPHVTEAAVVARTDAQWGQRVTAFVVASSSLDAEQLRAWCRSHLLDHEIPKTIEFVDTLPKTPSGKVDVGSLR